MTERISNEALAKMRAQADRAMPGKYGRPVTAVSVWPQDLLALLDEIARHRNTTAPLGKETTA